MDLRERAKAVPPWAWFAAVAVAALAVLVWHQWSLSSVEGESWLDPEQPALKLPEGAPAQRARQRCYPDSLAGWSGSVIGDC